MKKILGASVLSLGILTGCESLQDTRVDIEIALAAASHTGSECNPLRAGVDNGTKYSVFGYETLAPHILAAAHVTEEFGTPLFNIEGSISVLPRDDEFNTHVLVTAAHVLDPKQDTNGIWRATWSPFALPSEPSPEATSAYIGVEKIIEKEGDPICNHPSTDQKGWFIPDTYDPETNQHDVAFYPLGAVHNVERLKDVPSFEIWDEKPTSYVDSFTTLRWDHDIVRSGLVYESGRQNDERQLDMSLAHTDSGKPLAISPECDPTDYEFAGIAVSVPQHYDLTDNTTTRITSGVNYIPASEVYELREILRPRIEAYIAQGQMSGDRWTRIQQCKAE